jgi:hypothetical protein
LAINLAYLALDRFRYRAQIEPIAEKQCKQNDEKAAFEEFHDLEPVKELKWLARRSTSRVHVPRGRGALAYRYLFRKHQDVVFAVAASILCAFTMAVGVAGNVGRWPWADYLLAWPIPALLFYGCLGALLIPGISVALGRKCVVWGQNRVTTCTAQVAIHLKALATNAEPPNAAPPPNDPRRVGPSSGPSMSLEERRQMVAAVERASRRLRGDS